MRNYKIEFILEDRIKESMNDSEMPLLSNEELLDILFTMRCSLPRGLEIRKGTMSVREIVDGRIKTQLIRR